MPQPILNNPININLKNIRAKGVWFYLIIIIVFTIISRQVYTYNLPVVEAVKAISGELTIDTHSVSSMHMSNSGAVYPVVDGIIKEILVTEGDEVRKGQHLFSIKSSESKVMRKVYSPSAGKIDSISVSLGDMASTSTILCKVLNQTTQEYSTLIPVNAVRKDSTGYYVYVLKKNDSILGKGYRTSRLAISVINSDENYAAVIGVNSEDYVITTSSKELEENKMVYYEGKID